MWVWTNSIIRQIGAALDKVQAKEATKLENYYGLWDKINISSF